MARGVMLDLDGTLVNTNYLHVLAWSIGAPEGTIDWVVHGGEVQRSKPAPDIFEAGHRSCRPSGRGRGRRGRYDLGRLAARRCGLSCVALQTGGIAPAELMAAGAAAVYKDPSDLLERLSTSPLARLLDQPR